MDHSFGHVQLLDKTRQQTMPPLAMTIAGTARRRVTGRRNVPFTFKN
jgi:hypothetical protein